MNKGGPKRSFPFRGDETLEIIPLGGESRLDPQQMGAPAVIVLLEISRGRLRGDFWHVLLTLNPCLTRPLCAHDWAACRGFFGAEACMVLEERLWWGCSGLSVDTVILSRVTHPGLRRLRKGRCHLHEARQGGDGGEE